MDIVFAHTGRRSNQLFDLAEKHGLTFHGGRIEGKNYVLKTSGKVTAEFRDEVKSLSYVVRVDG